MLVNAGFWLPVLDVLSLELLAGIVTSPCPDVACKWCAMTGALGCGCWKYGYCMQCRPGVLCAKLQGVFMEKNRMKMPNYSRRFPIAPPSLLIMFCAQTVPLAGIWVGCRWLCVGFTPSGGVGC